MRRFNSSTSQQQHHPTGPPSSQHARRPATVNTKCRIALARSGTDRPYRRPFVVISQMIDRRGHHQAPRGRTGAGSTSVVVHRRSSHGAQRDAKSMYSCTFRLTDHLSIDEVYRASTVYPDFIDIDMFQQQRYNRAAAARGRQLTNSTEKKDVPFMYIEQKSITYTD